MNKLTIIRKLVSAMRRSISEGCTDNLDSCDDHGAFWHDAIDVAEKLLSNKDLESGQ